MRWWRTTEFWRRHAEKAFLGVALCACALAIVSFWNRGAEPPVDRPVPFDAFTVSQLDFPNFDHPLLPTIAADLATDPHEYRPRIGEHVCVRATCTRILPDTCRYCPVCGADQKDRDLDGMNDDFEHAHEATNPDMPDADVDFDGDRFTNIEEYAGGSNPDDPASIPAPIRLVQIDQKVVDILFRGLARRRNGARAIQLNWGNDTQTTILDMGSAFRGYTLKTLQGRSELILERPGGSELVLPRHTWVREPERFGIFIDISHPNERASAYPGESIVLDGHTYGVIDVTEHGARVLGDRGEQYRLELRPE